MLASLSQRTFLTFGGIETYLLFLQKFPLRELCAFEVAGDEAAWRKMEDELLGPIADTAAERGLGLITDCLVWRASKDYVDRLGHKERGVAAVNQLAVDRTRRFLREWQAKNERTRATPLIIAADVGPRGDGYAIAKGAALSADTAYDYHAAQVDALAAAGVELIVALTMTSLEETLGILRAAERANLPVLVSPTVETDGRLPDGSTLSRFIAATDQATHGYPVAYMANCAHPTHLAPTLRSAADAGESWLKRFRGLRANASAKTHAELDNSTELDRGDPDALARAMAELQESYNFTILGGCCGTDAEHLRAIARYASATASPR